MDGLSPATEFCVRRDGLAGRNRKGEKMKKKFLAGLAIGLLMLGMAGVADADTINVFVDGRSGPWDVSLNPSYSYGGVANGGTNVNLEPTIVDSSSGLPMIAGDTLTITYTGGLALAGAGGTLWFDANGVPGWNYTDFGSPGYYLPADQTIQLETLMGVFASNGIIIGDPFKIGNGPIDILIPIGSSQLLLGFDDGWFNDNGGGVNVNISETSAPGTPEPATMLLLGTGIALGLAGSRLRRKK